MKNNKNQMILQGDCRKLLKNFPANHFHCVVTSPPYWGLRYYGKEAPKRMIGMEKTFDKHLANLLTTFSQVKRVLRDDGIFWLNYGDLYGSDGELLFPVGKLITGLAGIGWKLRSVVIWEKKQALPNSVGGTRWQQVKVKSEDGASELGDYVLVCGSGRVSVIHEYILQLVKGDYFYDMDSNRVPHKQGQSIDPERPTLKLGKKQLVAMELGIPNARTRLNRPKDYFGNQLGANLNSVWRLSSELLKEAHFAAFPTTLVERCVRLSTSDSCCSKCGACYAPVVTKERKKTRPARTNKKNDDKLVNRDIHRHVTITTITDYWPTCDCRAVAGKCKVLDPFAGSGTVGVVCKRLGREFVGLELKPEYCEMAKRRIRKELLPPTPLLPAWKM